MQYLLIIVYTQLLWCGSKTYIVQVIFPQYLWLPLRPQTWAGAHTTDTLLLYFLQVLLLGAFHTYSVLAFWAVCFPHWWIFFVSQSAADLAHLVFLSFRDYMLMSLKSPWFVLSNAVLMSNLKFVPKSSKDHLYTILLYNHEHSYSVYWDIHTFYMWLECFLCRVSFRCSQVSSFYMCHSYCGCMYTQRDFWTFHYWSKCTDPSYRLYRDSDSNVST